MVSVKSFMARGVPVKFMRGNYGRMVDSSFSLRSWLLWDLSEPLFATDEEGHVRHMWATGRST